METRWLRLDEGAATAVSNMIMELVFRSEPKLMRSFGIGVETAAETLVVVGDNPESIRSESALAKLAGISPVPAYSGMASGRHRLNRGEHRH